MRVGCVVSFCVERTHSCMVYYGDDGGLRTEPGFVVVWHTYGLSFVCVPLM